MMQGQGQELHRMGCRLCLELHWVIPIAVHATAHALHVRAHAHSLAPP